MNVLFSSRCFLRCAGTTVGAGKPSRRATSRLIPAPSNTGRENALFKFCRRAQRQRASTRVRQENATRMAVLLSRVFRRRDGKNRQNQTVKDVHHDSASHATTQPTAHDRGARCSQRLPAPHARLVPELLRIPATGAVCRKAIWPMIVTTGQLQADRMFLYTLR